SDPGPASCYSSSWPLPRFFSSPSTPPTSSVFSHSCWCCCVRCCTCSCTAGMEVDMAVTEGVVVSVPKEGSDEERSTCIWPLAAGGHQRGSLHHLRAQLHASAYRP